jgi:hypothetical protein
MLRFRYTDLLAIRHKLVFGLLFLHMYKINTRTQKMVKRKGRPLRSPCIEEASFTALAAAFAPGIASAAAHNHCIAPADDTRAVLVGSPAGTAVPVSAAHTAGCRAIAVAAGSMVAAVAVASTYYPCS